MRIKRMESNVGGRLSALRRGLALVCAALLGGAASAATIYVDGASGADGNDGRSEAAAKKTIQSAVDAAAKGDVVLVAPGEYGAFDTQGKDITVRSTAGAERTKIRGGDRLMGLGYATAANLISDDVNSQIGDSKEDGRTWKYDVVKEWKTWRPDDLPGSALEGFTVEVRDLPDGARSLDGNVYAIVGGRVRRCRFVCADGPMGGFAHLNLSVAENCLFVSGTLEDEIVADCCLRNCTVYTGAYLCGSELLNTVVYARGKNVYLDEAVRPPVSNCVFFGVRGVSGRSGITVADPLFVDAANGDFRLRADSPCVNAGASSYALAETDLDGNPRVANGRVDVGCYEYAGERPEPGEGGLAATELEYSGEVYRYGTYKGGGCNEVTLESAAWFFECDAAPSSFPGKSAQYVAVPVVLKSGSVTPENVAISLEGVVHPGELSAAKVYDDRTFMKMVCPTDTSKWVDCGDEWEYDKGKEYRDWPKDVWPDKVSVSSRYWILAQVNAGGDWSGLTHLRVEVRDDNRAFDPIVVPLLRGGMADDFPGERIFGGSSMTVKSLSKPSWVTFRAGLTWMDDAARPWFDYCTATDGGDMPIDVREAGVLRVVYLFEDGEELRVRGKNIVSSKVTELNWRMRCLEVEVSAATTLTVYNANWSDVYIREISFWPSGSRCARVAADYVERCDLDDGCGLPYLRGYVLGSGVYKSGEAATLTAVAGNTSVFVRWESDGIALDPTVATNAHLSFTVPASVCADAADRAEVRIRAVWRDRLPGEIGPAPSYAVVPGAQVSIAVPDLVGYAAKGLPAGLRFDAKTGTISGAATKPTTEAGVTVTFTKKGAETYTTQIFVGPLPVLAVECDLDKGKVTGAGAYAAGKKATLKATAAKGYVFAGWYEDSGFTTPFDGSVDYRTPSMPYVTGTEDATMYARFVPAEEDAGISLVGDFLDFDLYWDDGTSELALEVESLSLPTVKVAGLPAGLKYDAKTMTISGKPTKPGTYTVKVTMSNATVKNMVKEFRIIVPNLVSEKIYGLESSPNFYRFVSGVSMDDSAIMPSAEDGYTLKFSGLPSGMKYDAKTGRVTGVPTKSGTYTVTVTGTKKGEPTETATITVTVDGMPEAVAGTYVGHIDYGGNMAGSFTLTATAAGKLTAKVVTTQGTVSFSAPSWTRVDGVADDYLDGRTFFADMADKAGRTLTVCVAASGEMDHVRNIYRDGNGVEFIVDAVRNAFSRKWYFAADGADGSWNLRGVPTAAEADMTVTFKDGTATVSGQIGGIKVGGSTVVRVDAAGLSVRLPAFVTVGGKKRIMAIHVHGALAGSATLMDER